MRYLPGWWTKPIPTPSMASITIYTAIEVLRENKSLKDVPIVQRTKPVRNTGPYLCSSSGFAKQRSFGLFYLASLDITGPETAPARL